MPASAPRSARGLPARRGSVSAAPEASFGLHEELSGAIGHALAFGPPPLRGAPGQIIPAEPRVMHLVRHDAGEERVRRRIGRPLEAAGEERRLKNDKRHAPSCEFWLVGHRIFPK